MQLILLGLLVIVGIVIYALVVYGSSVDDEDIRPAGERFSDVFEKIRDRFYKGASYTIVDDDEEDDADIKSAGKNEGQTLFFPTDAEVEKESVISTRSFLRKSRQGASLFPFRYHNIRHTSGRVCGLLSCRPLPGTLPRLSCPDCAS